MSDNIYSINFSTDPVTSPYCLYTAPTVHVCIASHTHIAFISVDVYNQCSKRTNDTLSSYHVNTIYLQSYR